MVLQPRFRGGFVNTLQWIPQQGQVTLALREHRSPVNGDANESQFDVRSAFWRPLTGFFPALPNRLRNWRFRCAGWLHELDEIRAAEDPDDVATAAHPAGRPQPLRHPK